MARPKKSEEEKHVKMSVSFDPKDLERIMKYCNAEERSISWVVRKAIDPWLKERGF